MSTSSRPNFVLSPSAVTPIEPTKNTSAVWMSRYSASKPMMEGVRMRLPVTVWNSTVDTPTE